MTVGHKQIVLQPEVMALVRIHFALCDDDCGVSIASTCSGLQK